jgi:hypothetical protein
MTGFRQRLDFFECGLKLLRRRLLGRWCFIHRRVQIDNAKRPALLASNPLSNCCKLILRCGDFPVLYLDDDSAFGA